MKASPFHLKARNGAEHRVSYASIERYSDRYESRPDLPLEINWDYFPAELKPENRKEKKKMKRTKQFKPNLSASKKLKDSNFLDDLEKKENANEDEEMQQENKKKVESDDEDEGEEGREEDGEGEDDDEELDEGTDYANNYFDSDVDDEDDNLDEGGIY